MQGGEFGSVAGYHQQILEVFHGENLQLGQRPQRSRQCLGKLVQTKRDGIRLTDSRPANSDYICQRPSELQAKEAKIYVRGLLMYSKKKMSSGIENVKVEKTKTCLI